MTVHPLLHIPVDDANTALGRVNIFTQTPFKNALLGRIFAAARMLCTTVTYAFSTILQNTFCWISFRFELYFCFLSLRSLSMKKYYQLVTYYFYNFNLIFKLDTMNEMKYYIRNTHKHKT